MTAESTTVEVEVQITDDDRAHAAAQEAIRVLKRIAFDNDVPAAIRAVAAGEILRHYRHYYG